MNINLPYQNEAVLFDGADTSGVDIAGSIAKFELNWVADILEAFPGARISFQSFNRIYVTGPRTEAFDAKVGDIENAVQALGEALYDDGDRWLVLL